MWPFKKRQVPAKAMPINVTSILCIPGPWKTGEEMNDAIVQATEAEYMAVTNFLLNGKLKQHFNLDICERDEKLTWIFATAGKATGLSEQALEQIGTHQHVCFLSGETGTMDKAKDLAFAAGALLKAGGAGVKVETAGKVFDNEGWLNYLSEFEEHHLYEMYVADTVTQEDGTIFSCGMHNLGFKDCIVSGLPFEEAVQLIRIFGYYQLVDKPMILPNQTFTPTIDSPVFRITEEKDQPYKDLEQFANPFGMWRLTKV